LMAGAARLSHANRWFTTAASCPVYGSRTLTP
jgi:hypothetical protein